MSAEGYAFTTQLAVKFVTIECYKCGVIFAVDESLQGNWLRDKTQFFCPNGHHQSYIESEADRLRKQLAETQQKLAWETSRVATVERKLTAATKATARLKRRVNHGVCPHCQRTVSQLAAHIKTKHPEQLPCASKT